jgi:hypothetical protein
MVLSRLDLAQRNTVKYLRSIVMGGDQMAPPSRCVQLYFSPRDYKVYVKAVMMHGASKSKKGKGLIGQANAVIAIARKALAAA